MQDADVGQIAETLVVVKTIAHNKFIGDFGTYVIGRVVDLAARGLIKQSDCANTLGAALAQQVGQQVDDRADRADGGERLVADVVPDDPRVDGVVELLKNVSDEEREGERDEVADDVPLGHVDFAFFADASYSIFDVFHDPVPSFR